MSADEKRISELAHQIWETEGKPDGQDARHWEMARKLAESEALAPKKPSKTNKPKELASVTSAAGKVGGAKADGAGNAKPTASKAAAKPAAKSAAKPAAKSSTPSPSTKSAAAPAPPATSPVAPVKKPRAPRKPSAT
ncbi:MAG: hypothetical protein JWQ69_3210 [Pseudomonas sp.]|nr:hypothetical protein [Pseudomonas sp.]